MLARLIERFEAIGRELADAVRQDNDVAVALADRDLVRQLDRILAHHARDARDVELQIRFFEQLVTRHSEDPQSVAKYSGMLVSLFRRYIEENGIGRPTRPAMEIRAGYDMTVQEMLLDSLPERIAVVGCDYRYIYTNERNARFHQVRPAAFIGRHIKEFIGEERFENRVRAKLDQCFAGASLSYSYEVSDVDGHRFQVTCRMAPLRDPSDAILGAAMQLVMQPLVMSAH